MDATLIFLGSGCLVCLVPVAVYLLYLAHLNGKGVPTLISGPWDFGAVLLGLSGFLLLAGPLLITVVDSAWRSHAFGGWANLKGVGREEALAGSLMASGYLIGLLGAIPILLRGRRRVTAIYNVAAGTVEPALTTALDDLGFAWRKGGGGIEIGAKRSAHTDPNRFFPHETATVLIQTFPGVGHASLKWQGAWTAATRAEVEAALPRALFPHAGQRNPVAGWMYTAAVAVLIVMLLWLVVLIYLVMTPPSG